MDHLLVDQLRDLYSAETQIEAAIPTLIARVQSGALRDVFERHFDDTGRNILRLQEMLKHLQASARGPRCLAMTALLQEAEEAARMARSGEVLDLMLAAGLRRVVVYELVGLGAARVCALRLDQQRVTDLLDLTLMERGEVEARLRRLTTTEELEEMACAAASQAMAERE